MKEDDNNWPLPDRVGKQELEIKMNGEHICFNTTKLGSVLQVQQSKDPDGLRIFYYLVQVRAAIQEPLPSAIMEAGLLPDMQLHGLHQHQQLNVTSARQQQRSGLGLVLSCKQEGFGTGMLGHPSCQGGCCKPKSTCSLACTVHLEDWECLLVPLCQVWPICLCTVAS